MKLSTIRTNKGFTQKEVATLLGLKRSTVAMWETGKCKPDILTVAKIAKALDVSVEEIINCFKE